MDFEKEVEELPEDALDAANRILDKLFDVIESPSSYPSTAILITLAKDKIIKLKKTNWSNNGFFRRSRTNA